MTTAPVLIKAKVTDVSPDHYTCSIQWYTTESSNSTEPETQDHSSNQINQRTLLLHQFMDFYLMNFCESLERKFSDLCEYKNKSETEHSNFVEKAHGSKQFESQLERCFNKNWDVQNIDSALTFCFKYGIVYQNSRYEMKFK